MPVRLNRKSVYFALAAVLLVYGGFASGFVSCLHLKTSPSSEVRQHYLQPPGDAPPEVRAGVLTTLRSFQDGYVKRDPKDLDAFMSRLFPKGQDVLILGTDGGEWARGYPAATKFFRADWVVWGDVRFAVDDSVISSSGDVAWVATAATVNFKGGSRPLRFSAVLTRSGNDWVFRQMSFQWDDRDPGVTEIFRLKTYSKLAGMMFRRITHGPAG